MIGAVTVGSLCRSSDCDVGVIGLPGGTHVGESFVRAARRLGCEHQFFDVRPAFAGPRVLRSAAWRLAGRRPLQLGRFSRDVLERCRQMPSRKLLLLATGAAPLTAAAVRALRGRGVVCAVFSTDDPWNPAHRAPWHLAALKEYDVVFTPRRANMADFARLGCHDVRHLPFGYDEALFKPTEATAEGGPDVLFVGGADEDRVGFMRAFLASGPTLALALVGGYWDKYADLRALHRGQLAPDELQLMTAHAAVNLCLVRRANRDGHVMRSFEIPAIGGFMLTEDTAEHRELFGEEGQCVLYFSSPAMAAEKARWALARPTERKRMAAAAHHLVVGGRHTYTDRLRHILETLRA